jgi:hypothetical protein
MCGGLIDYFGKGPFGIDAVLVGEVYWRKDVLRKILGSRALI